LTSNEEALIDRLKDEIGDLLLSISLPREKRIFIEIPRKACRKVAEKLRLGFHGRLSTITGMDLGSDFKIVYHFDIKGVLVNVATKVPKAIARIDSITPAVPSANFYEREITDLLGINFEGHPEPKRAILPDKWPERRYPLRKW